MAASSNVPKPRLSLEALEDRTTPVFLPRLGGPLFVNAIRVPVGGASIAVADIVPEGIANLARSEYITGTGPGVEGLVRIWDNNGSLISQFVAFAGFQGGINVAAGDVLGNGSPEIIVSIAANGPPHVKVFTPAGQLLASFYSFTDAAGNPSYLGGVNIAVGNVLNEGNGGPDRGVGTGGFFGGNNSSFKQEIVVGSAGGGIQGHVKVFDGNGREFRSFNPFEGGFFGGVSVAASSVDTTRTPGSSGGGGGFGGGNQNRPRDTNSYAEVIVGATDGAPHVKIFSAWQSPQVITLQSYFAFDPSLGRGITVAAGSTDGGRGAEVYAALIGGDQIGGAPVRIFNGETSLQRGQFLAFPPTYSRVVNIAVGNVTNFDPRDDDEPGFGNNGNPFFQTQDLAITAGDGPYEQIPRVFFGRAGSPAGLNGP
jgi:hypothetical protein